MEIQRCSLPWIGPDYSHEPRNDVAASNARHFLGSRVANTTARYGNNLGPHTVWLSTPLHETARMTPKAVDDSLAMSDKSMKLCQCAVDGMSQSNFPISPPDPADVGQQLDELFMSILEGYEHLQALYKRLGSQMNSVCAELPSSLLWKPLYTYIYIRVIRATSTSHKRDISRGRRLLGSCNTRPAWSPPSQPKRMIILPLRSGRAAVSYRWNHSSLQAVNESATLKHTSFEGYDPTGVLFERVF